MVLKWGLLFLLVGVCLSQTSLPPHPRLLVLDEQLPVILKAISVDKIISDWFTKVVEDADALLTQPPTQWVSGRMLTESRQVLSRVTTLAGVFRLTSNVAYANRAIQEMLVAAQMPGWCPNSFLDPSEMTNALAIGYDWLYNLMTEGERANISAAIYDKGLKYGVEFYAGNYTQDPALAPTPLYPSGFDWATVFFNWNQVCNGGMLMGALSVWEEYPSVAQYILNSSIPSIEISISAYAPNGGWVESPTYGIYASNYAAYYLGALNSVFGHDFGITERHPYLAGYGNFHVSMKSTKK
eukprot:Phypoly_transcript_12082.p1 GENE.Phypoly_transcript_12082~~Phypoly_transcript_12082.p1  ORF type:complete len:297 (+),score=46.47 Phypoly_transcript_12082:43-933(+)